MDSKEVWGCFPMSTVCIKKWYSQEKNYLDMILVEKLCVLDIILKRNNSSFCCFWNHIIYFRKSRTKQLICEDNGGRNYWSIFQYDMYYLVAHVQTHKHTHKQKKHTRTHLSFCTYVTHSSWLVCVGVCMFVYVCMCVLSSTCTNTPYIHHTHAH